MNLPCVKDISHGHRARSLAEGGGRSSMSSIKGSQKQRELLFSEGFLGDSLQTTFLSKCLWPLQGL